MTYTADKKMFISEFMKVMIFCNILHLIMFPRQWWVLMIILLCLYIDISRDKSLILPSCEISDLEVSLNKFTKIKFSEIDLKKSKINKNKIVLIHKVDTWKNKVRIYPKIYKEDIRNIIATKIKSLA